MQAEARLKHLEQLIHQLAKNGDDTIPFLETTDQRVNREATDFGALSNREPVFAGPTHWSAMLEDIEGLKSAIITSEPATTDENILEYEEATESNLILGSAAPMSVTQVLSQYLPPKQEANRLTAAYFRSNGVCAPFIHASSFWRLYQDFWRDPQRVSPLWTSIFFSICHIAKNTLTLGKENIYSTFDDKYSIASAHCLAHGEYFRPKRFSVESLLLFVQAKCLTNLAMSPDSGLLCGLLIRLATTMGYHRDPDMFQLSAFDGEMRRRTWSLCMQMDLLISFQLGLPSNIQFPTWDTRPPRNLQDSDFDEDTIELPPERPVSDCTDILFYIAKHRLMTVFEKILRHNLSTMNKSSDAGELDTEITAIYSKLPEILRPRPMADSVVDSPSLIVTRLCVFFVYQKCLCVLHRPYVTLGRAYSIQICFDAASNIVRYFIDMYKEFLPGGQLETERWFMSNITWHDYLLAVTALCLVICARSQTMAALDLQSIETLQLLRRARDVCMEHSSKSKDSEKVQKVVNATLQHFDSFGNTYNGESMNISFSTKFPIKSIESSFIQSPVNGDQSSAHHVLIPPQTEVSRAVSQNIETPMDDSTWAFLEQFLNLSNIDAVEDRR